MRRLPMLLLLFFVIYVCSSLTTSNPVSSLYKEYFQNCKDHISICQYHHVSIPKLNYHSVSKSVDHFIVENRKFNDKKEESSRITFFGIESSDHESLSNHDVLKELDLFLAERPFFDLAYVEPHY